MRHGPARSGFTLLEVLLALGLVGMLAGSIFGFMWNMQRVRDSMAGEARDGQAGGAVMERIEADVLCGLAGDESIGAGISGTATTLKVLTRGVEVPKQGAGPDRGDLQWSEYAFDRGAGTVKARRGKVGATPEFEQVSDHLEWARLRYFDGTRWTESFDSLQADGLPVAIEVALWFGKPWKAEGSAEASEAPAPEAQTKKEEAKREGRAGADRAGSSGSSGPMGPSREPDRLRVIVVPDGPVASWKDGR